MTSHNYRLLHIPTGEFVTKAPCTEWLFIHPVVGGNNWAGILPAIFYSETEAKKALEFMWNKRHIMTNDRDEVNRLYSTKKKMQIEFIILTTTLGEEKYG
ncbi:MAG: hypothetical protein JHC33_01955 [Ignisphaera sp.]|nr:hypothetical protein [Ignisphaera sp.]